MKNGQRRILTWCFVKNLTTGQFSLTLIPGDAFGMSPTSVLVWKLLDGNHTAKDIDAVRVRCSNAPAEASEHIQAFISDLVEHGYVCYDAPA